MKALVDDKYASWVVVHGDVASRIQKGAKILLNLDRQQFDTRVLAEAAKDLGGTFSDNRLIVRDGASSIDLGSVDDAGIWRANRNALNRLSTKIIGTSTQKNTFFSSARSSLSESVDKLTGLWYRFWRFTKEPFIRVGLRLTAGVGAAFGVFSLTHLIYDSLETGGMAALGDNALDITVMSVDTFLSIAASLGYKFATGPPGWICAVFTIGYFAIKHFLNYRDEKKFFFRKITMLIDRHENELSKIP
jgi:hypothetical protein